MTGAFSRAVQRGPLPETTNCLVVDSLIQPTRVLLGVKKRGLGVGKIVGIGGHVELGEMIVDAAVREVREEVGLILAAAELVCAARLEYEFPFRPQWRMASNVFLAQLPQGGVPVETDEVQPHWFSVAKLPTDRMWDDAKTWLGRVLGHELLHAYYEFGPCNQLVATSHIRRVDLLEFGVSRPGLSPGQ